MKFLKRYIKFNEELSGPGNLPQFVFKGVNYGDDNKTPRDHFGDKNGSPKTKSLGIDLDEFIMGEDGDFYDQDDVKDLLIKYDVWLKQNNEKSIPLDKLDSKTITYIADLIGYNL